MVNGDGQGPIGTASVLSEVAPTYAPAGRALVVVSVADQAATDSTALLGSVRGQLRDWFGGQVETWRHLRTDRISRALPPLARLATQNGEDQPRLRRGVYQCGDYCASGTLDGALCSGRHAAEAILADFMVV